MAIKPILFNTEMVRAILNGRKSCTRRINKDANDYVVPDMDFYNGDRRTYAVHNFADKEQMEQLSTAERTCPICPRDILYVRETWKKAPNGYYYYEDWQRDDIADVTKWKPSIHMPKEAARIWLKVTNVRVERLQDMTDDDAEAEGCFDYTSTALGFPDVWDSTIKKSDLDRYGWDANPWVWVIEFERCEKPEGV
ncbi:MAG TPA: hypothetical protein DC035_02795 [Lachnospiraceae bacterium]|nr:hypothetical protein [Lachnospiraceae bacterium]